MSEPKRTLAELLNAAELFTAQEASASPEAVVANVATLYEVSQAEIEIKSTETISTKKDSTVLRVQAEVQGEEKKIIIKDSWEGADAEALGMELHNLLTDSPMPYLQDGETLVFEGWQGEEMDSWEPVAAGKEDFYEALGRWMVVTDALQLCDRLQGAYESNIHSYSFPPKNLIWDDAAAEIRNCDYGPLFVGYHFVKMPIMPPGEWAHRKDAERGIDEARQMLTRNVARNKDRLEELANAFEDGMESGTLSTYWREPRGMHFLHMKPDGIRRILKQYGTEPEK